MSSQSTTPGQGPGRGRPAVPAVLRLALLVLVAEAVVLAVLGGLELAHLDRSRLAMGVTTTAFFLGYAVALVACAWGLARLVPWARGPVLFTQLVALGLAWNFRGNGPVALVLVAAAALVLLGLLHPSTTAALEDDEVEG